MGDISGFDFSFENFHPCANEDQHDYGCVEWIMSVVFMIFGSTLYAIVLLNLMIAMYSSYFEKMVPQAQMLIQMERAKSCVNVLTRPKIPDVVVHAFDNVGGKVLRDSRFARYRFAVVFLPFLLAIWLLCVALRLGAAAGFPLGVALLVVQSFLIEQDIGDKPHYLWICYRNEPVEVVEEARATKVDIERLETQIKQLRKLMLQQTMGSTMSFAEHSFDNSASSTVRPNIHTSSRCF